MIISSSLCLTPCRATHRGFPSMLSELGSIILQIYWNRALKRTEIQFYKYDDRLKLFVGSLCGDTGSRARPDGGSRSGI